MRDIRDMCDVRDLKYKSEEPCVTQNEVYLDKETTIMITVLCLYILAGRSLITSHSWHKWHI